MSRHDPLIRMRHMYDYASEAVVFIKGKTKEDLVGNRLLQLSLLQLMEMIGEAASHISREDRKKYQEIPWDNIIGMRHRLIHGYDIVDYDVVWTTIVEDLPPLISALKEILE